MKIENREKVREIDDKIERIDGLLRNGIHLFFINSGYLQAEDLFKELKDSVSNERFLEVVDFIKSKMREERKELLEELEKM